MRFLTADESRAWAASNGFAFGGGHRYADLGDHGFTAHRFAIPSDAGRRIAFGKLLWESVAEGRARCLIWVTDWSVWPSGEHMPLALAVRKAFGEERSLGDAPGTELYTGEDSQGISLLTLALLFLWDTYVLSGAGQMAVFVSHDEYGVFLTRSADAGESLQRKLTMFFGSVA